jgi:hypothetical protein
MNIKQLSLSVVAAVLSVTVSPFAFLTSAQAPKRTNSKAAARKQPKEEEAGPLASQRRTVAVSLLTTLAEEARSYSDQALRSRVQARSADALWESDAEFARAMFRRAWETASNADRDYLRKYEEERQRQANARTSTYIRPPPDLRLEVLRLVARRDQGLSDEFLTQLVDESKRADSQNNNAVAGPTMDPEAPPLEIIKRLQLASDLLESGDIGRALTFADKALDRVTTIGIFFLCDLREKDQAAADLRFARMLANTVTDPSSDAVGVSVLSTYAFTPYLYVIVRRDGRNHSSQRRERIVAPNIPPELRLAFLKGAASILLRPVPPPDQDRTIAGRRGLYFTAARLLPLFEQFAPDLAPELRVQLAALAGDVPEDMRNGRNPWLTRGLVAADELADEGREALERAERLGDTAQRDQLYVRAALAAAAKGDIGARDLLEKISDSELRKRARAHVDFTLVNRAIEKKETQEALRLLHNAEISHIQRAWALLEVSKAMHKTDPTRAVELLNEAAQSARRIDGGDADRARALVGIATQTYAVDHGKVWDAILEAVKAANSVSDFSGQDAQLVVRFRYGGGTTTTNFSVNSFDLDSVFAALAKEDLYRSIEMARAFTSDPPRAAATLAIARSILRAK